MAKGQSRKNKSPGTKYTKKTKTKAPTTMPAQVALIKKVIARENETKYRSELVCPSTTYNSAIANSDIIRLLPKLVQGQGDSAIYEREGMKISPQKLRVDAEVCLTDVSRSTAVVVCYWVLQHKEVRQTGNLSTIGMSFLKTGSDTQVQAFNGYVEDANLPVDNAKFTVLKRGKFMLGKNTGTVQDSTTASNQPMYGNHIRHALSFNLNCPKTLVYEQDAVFPRTVFYPGGYAPFIVFGYYHQNQTGPDNTNQDITVNVRSHLWFDDA